MEPEQPGDGRRWGAGSRKPAGGNEMCTAAPWIESGRSPRNTGSMVDCSMALPSVALILRQTEISLSFRCRGCFVKDQNKRGRRKLLKIQVIEMHNLYPYDCLIIPRKYMPLESSKYSYIVKWFL